jgi:hypothetical protein
MKTLINRLWNEPALFLSAANAIVQAVQLAALDLPNEWNIAIGVAGAILQGLITRPLVTPVGNEVVAEVPE